MEELTYQIINYMKRSIILTIVLFLSIFSANAQWKKIKGNGNSMEDKRSVGNFDEVVVSGHFTVVLQKGHEGDLVISAEENLLEYIITEVRGNKLKISTKKGYTIRTSKKIEIVVNYQDIGGIILSGSGKITATDKLKSNEFDIAVSGSGSVNIELEAHDVDIALSGSGSLKLAGNTDDMSCAISGSGNINGYEMSVNKVTARISGSGSAKFHVKDEIHAITSGSGNIRYTGNPKIIDAKSSGSGSIKKKN